jgi:hypothetical protein
VPDLAEGESRPDLNFGYQPGAISGYAYVDVNGNQAKDGGEPGIGGVTITFAGGSAGTTTTAADGSYSFQALDADTYSVTAPASAAGKALATPSPLNVVLGPGQSHPNVNFGYVPGGVSGFAYVDSNGNGVRDVGEAGIGGVTITLSGTQAGTVTTAADGSYLFAGLSAGVYSVSAPETASGMARVTPSPLSIVLAPGEIRPDVNFGYRTAAAYVTYTQGGWGAPPNGNNPGMLLKNNFATVYPTGVTIGGSPYNLKFTSASAIEAFLPAGGKPGVLNKSATNPKSSSANVFGGQVLALQLSVDFSNAGITTVGLSARKVAPGNPMAGSTVAQVLAVANQVIAGNPSALPTGMSVSNLNDVVSRINENYDNGTTNNGYLVP